MTLNETVAGRLSYECEAITHVNYKENWEKLFYEQILCVLNISYAGALQSARDEALEEAAKEIEKNNLQLHAHTQIFCAGLIRALKSTPLGSPSLSGSLDSSDSKMENSPVNPVEAKPEQAAQERISNNEIADHLDHAISKMIEPSSDAPEHDIKGYRYTIRAMRRAEMRLRENVVAPDWRPIETAPKDGTEILLAVPLDWKKSAQEERDPRIGTGYHIGAYWFVDGLWRGRIAQWVIEKQPTHWQPIKPPSALKTPQVERGKE